MDGGKKTKKKTLQISAWSKQYKDKKKKLARMAILSDGAPEQFSAVHCKKKNTKGSLDMVLCILKRFYMISSSIESSEDFPK